MELRLARFPIEAFLAGSPPPDTLGSSPGGATERFVIAAGVPREIPLDRGWSVVVQVPTGVIVPWVEADPDAIVTTHAAEDAPVLPGAPWPEPIGRSPGRLVVRRGGPPIAAVPLVRGDPRTVRSGNLLLELSVVAWDLTVRAVVGGAGAGFSFTLAWRTSFSALPFAPPPIPPAVAARPEQP